MRSILFHIGPVPIRSYGFMIVVGFVLGLWRAARVSKRFGIEPERIIDAAIIALISGIAGARLLFLLLQVPANGWGSFSQAYRIWEGGLSFHGGLVAAILAVGVYAKAKQIRFLTLADVLAPSVAIGYAFARIGCFMNGCCYGVETNLPWAIRFFNPITHAFTAPSHPVQIYAFFISLGIFGILTRIEKLKRPAGFTFFSFITLYSAYRFGIEFLRKGATAEVWFAGLTQAQVVSIATAIIFGIMLVVMNRKR